MLKFQDDYTTIIATFEDFICSFILLLMTCTISLFPLPFHKDEMWILLKCPTLELLP